MPLVSGPHPLARLLALLIFTAFSFAQTTVAQQPGAANLRVIATSEGKPVAGALVEIRLNGSAIATAITNASGEAEFGNISKIA